MSAALPGATRWPVLATALTLLAVAAPRAQDAAAEQPPAAALAAGDELEVEIARRRLAAGDAVPEPVLLRLLRSPDAFRRRAAGWLLARHGAGTDAVAEWARGETDLHVLRPALSVLPDALLDELIADPPAPEAAFAAVDERLRRGGPQAVVPATWARLLRSDDLATFRRAVRLVVGAADPLPVAELAALDGMRLGALLEELARRPRVAAQPLLRRLHAAPDRLPDTAARLHLLLALPPQRWEPSDGRFVIDALVGVRDGDTAAPGAARAAAEAVDHLGSDVADQLVAHVHQRLREDTPADDLLFALDRVSPRGERHLAASARALDIDAQREIATWLVRRESAAAEPLLADLLDGEGLRDPRILRLAGDVIDGDDPAEQQRARRVLAVIDDAEASLELREAALFALADAGRYEPALLEFVLDHWGAGRRSSRRLTRLLELHAQIPLAAYRRLAALPAARDVARVLQLAARAAHDRPELGELLVELASDRRALARDPAVIAALRSAPESVAQQAWQQLDDGERATIARELARADRPWWRRALRGLAARTDAEEVQRALLAVGERAVVDDLLADPDAFSLRFLRRTDRDVAALLRPADAPRVFEILAESDGERRLCVLRWLAGCPELGGTELLRGIAARPSDELEGDELEARYLALRALAARPAERARMLERLAAELPGGLDRDARELALEVLGAAQTARGDAPLDAELAGFVARLALVEPLARARADLAERGMLDGVAVAGSFDRVMSRCPPEVARRAVTAAADEVRAHPDGALLRRERVGRLLQPVARDAALRAAVGPPLARLIVDLPDLAPQWLGPAAHLLAEAAAAAGDHAAAAAWARTAAVRFRTTPPDRLVRRAVVGDDHPGGGLRSGAFLAARPLLFTAHDRLRAGAPATEVRSLLTSARDLGAGDDRVAAAVDALEQELDDR